MISFLIKSFIREFRFLAPFNLYVVGVPAKLFFLTSCCSGHYVISIISAVYDQSCITFFYPIFSLMEKKGKRAKQ